MNRCLICQKESESLVCEQHMKPYQNILEGYEAWRKAKGLSWSEYLAALVENRYAGAWVKILAKRMLELGIVPR